MRHQPLSFLWVSLISLAGAGLVLLVAMLDVPGDILSYLGLWVGVSFFILLLARHWSQGRIGSRLGIWEPPVLYSLWALGSSVFGLAAFSDDPRLRLQQLGPDSSYLNAALALMGLGLTALWVGYRVGSRWPPNQQKKGQEGPLNWRERFARPDLGMTLLIYALTTITRVGRLLAGGGTFGGRSLGVLDQTVNYIADLSYLVLALVALQVFLKRWPRKILYVILGIELFFVSLTAFIGYVVVIGLIVLGAAHHAYTRIRMRLVLLFAALIVIITPVTIAMRVQIASGQTQLGSIPTLASAAWAAFASTWFASPAEVADIAYAKLFGRLGGNIQMVGVALRYIPEQVPFVGVAPLLQSPLLVIPRFLWPGKPSPTLLGGFVSVEFLGMDPETAGATALTVFGDLYLHGGVSAVVIGMLGLGVFVAFLYRLLSPSLVDRSYLPLVALWLALVSTTFNPEFGYQDIVQTLLQRPFVFLLATLVICLPSPVDLRSRSVIPKPQIRVRLSERWM